MKWVVGIFLVGIGCTNSDVPDDTGPNESDTEETDTDETDTDETDTETDETDTDETDTDTDTGPQSQVKALSGQIEWVVDFDDAAEANGFTDCKYVREYSGIEDRSQPWLCPDCVDVFVVDVEMTSGLEDCFKQIASEPPPVEWLGWTAEGAFKRGGRENYLLTEQGTRSGTDDAFTTVHAATIEMEDGGAFSFDITGSFAVGEGEGDPMRGYTVPETYSCGWPKTDREAYAGSYELAVGEILPDGVFKDRCDEPVRLHDFEGRYLIVDISAVNCPPCQSMAEQEPAFVEVMAGEGIEVEMVTLMAPSLSAVLDPTETQVLIDWTTEFGLKGPVLGDRGYGYWLGKGALGDDFAYPSWVLVAPDLTVFEMGKGFSNFDGIGASIRTHNEGS